MNSFTFVASFFEPLISALTKPGILWAHRWRLIPLQLAAFPLYLHAYVTSPKRQIVYIPTRGKHNLRAIVFNPEDREHREPRPLHIDFHGGAFLGGIAEYDAPFCALLRDRSAAVVVSVQYRHAPANVYPAAHEDAEDAVEWLLLTVSGFSAGANLMMVAGRRARAAVGFYAPVSLSFFNLDGMVHSQSVDTYQVDLSVPPWEKPTPPGFPTTDPTKVLLPLYDAYAAGCGRDRKSDPRLSPIFKSAKDLPQDLLLIVPAIDILVHEQLSFVERLKEEAATRRDDNGNRIEAVMFDKGFHGWLEVPSAIIDNRGDREKAFGAAIDFIMEAHRRQ
ncbi:hypothetical protein Q7P37_000099 [Cladosporium fusiforme]